MISLQFNFWQLIGLVIIGILFVFVAKEIVKFLNKVIFTNKWVVNWSLKREAQRKKLIQKSQLQQIGENIASLEQFIEWVEKQIPKNQHKQFWRDFSDSKDTRTYWVKILRDLVTRKEQELNKPFETKLPIKENNNAPQGIMPTKS